jgi:Kef-type K+ transport system membrane component KefB
MTLATVSTLVLIAVAAVLAPVLAELTGPVGVPDVVIQLSLGILVGPAVLGIAHPDSVVTALADMGLAYLIFLAGYELDLRKVAGTPLRLAVIGWGMSLIIAFAAAAALVWTGEALSTLVVGLALTTTALGVLVPVLRDSGLAAGRFGTLVIAIGTVGEFGPIVAVALLLDRRNPLETSTLLVLFTVVAALTAVVASRRKHRRVSVFMHRHLQSSAQMPVRVSILLILCLVYLAFRLGIDILLGAFTAGIVFRLFVHGPDRAVVTGKLEAIGFGFLIPIFFIVSGMQFDLAALTSSAGAVLRLPLFLALFLVVRGAPALLLYRRDLPRGQRVPLALFSATGLPLIVVITSIGVTEGRMLPVNAAALVGAGMLSVLLYPLIAKALLRRVDPTKDNPPAEADNAEPSHDRTGSADPGPRSQP